MQSTILRPDAKGRINLGEIARNVSSYRITVETNGQILLEPYVEIPLSDKWIFEDKELLNKLKQENQEKQT
ncbi:MAG: hypothetical protein RI883_2136 [Bacteroidota bacterium]|jgi:hypothetical protein